MVVVGGGVEKESDSPESSPRSSDRRDEGKADFVMKALMRTEAGALLRACTLTEACLRDITLPATSSSPPDGRLRLTGFFYLQECVSHINLTRFFFFFKSSDLKACL